MPVQGRHKVEIGSSLARALKARKLNGEAPPPNKRSHLPDKDFYSFRCMSPLYLSGTVLK